MSVQQLISHLGECRRRLSEVRGRTDYLPLCCAILLAEGEGGRVLDSDPFAVVLRWRLYMTQVAFGNQEGSFRVAFFPSRNDPTTDQFNAALAAVESLTSEAQRLLSGLPRAVRESLVLPRGDNWWRTVFHLAWHFPRPFLRASRQRLLTEDGTSFSRVDETFVQMHGVGNRRDLLPGLIFSDLEHDIGVCSESAIDVVLEVLHSCRRTATPAGFADGVLSPEQQALFRQLRAEFEIGAGLPLGIESKLMKLADSFETPPASEWAALRRGASPERFLLLSRLNDLQEWCQIRGPAVERYCELAERAGQALPADKFPDQPILFFYPRCNDAGKPVVIDGAPLGISGQRPVMHRSPVERWVGFVFAVLKETGHNALRVRWMNERMAPDCHALARLDRNLFAASVLAIDLAGLTGETAAVLGVLPSTMIDGQCPSRDSRFGGWEILQDAPAEQVSHLPAPAVGRWVIALDPPTLDGFAELRGETRYVPRLAHLALLWENDRGKEVLHQLDVSGCLLMGCQNDATWLPDGWEMDVFPTGWSLPHLEVWFAYALEMAKMDDRKDIPAGSDRSPPYAPTPRGLVSHAHLIVRHLSLPDPPNEPRGTMDRAGCIAELRDVLGYFRSTLQLTGPRTDPPLGGSSEPRTPLDPKEVPRVVQRGRAKINARMLETIQNNPEAMGWTSPQWAKHLKCAKSSVVDTETWKDLTMRRQRNRAERAQDRRQRSKSSGQRGD
jgi:hypothetical protein